jgi:hypothetical protein
MFLILSQWIGRGQDAGGEMVGVLRVDLSTGDHELWKTDVAGSLRFFVTELVGADPPGENVYAIAGFRSETGLGTIEYAVAHLTWSTRKVTKLSSFEGVFF